MRAKVKHKVAESHRKQKKHAKTDPTWRSSKSPCIPQSSALRIAY